MATTSDPFVLVADAATFRRKAGRMMDRGRLMLVADMPIHPIPGHSWSEDLVPFEKLAERLGATKLEPALTFEAEPVSDEDRLIGSWGELEVIRRLAFLEATCLVIPSEVIPSLASVDGPNYKLQFRPAGSNRASRVDRYRIPLESLTETFDRHLG